MVIRSEGCHGERVGEAREEGGLYVRHPDPYGAFPPLRASFILALPDSPGALLFPPIRRRRRRRRLSLLSPE